MCTQYVLVSILFISKIGVAETVKANFRSEVQFLASSRGLRNIMVADTDKCYKLTQTVIRDRASTTLGGINVSDCKKSAEAYDTLWFKKLFGL